MSLDSYGKETTVRPAASRDTIGGRRDSVRPRTVDGGHFCLVSGPTSGLGLRPSVGVAVIWSLKKKELMTGGPVCSICWTEGESSVRLSFASERMSVMIWGWILGIALWTLAGYLGRCFDRSSGVPDIAWFISRRLTHVGDFFVESAMFFDTNH